MKDVDVLQLPQPPGTAWRGEGQEEARPAADDAGEALRRSNARLQAVLDSITDGLLVVDRSWRLSYVNRLAAEIVAPLAKTRDALLGTVLWEAFPALLGTRFETEYRRAMAEGVTVELEEFYPPLAAWFAVRAYPSRDGLSLFFQDVTRRKQAELRLASERAILEMITTGAPLAAILERIVRETEQQSVDGMLCSILLADASGQRLLHGAAPSLPAEYNAAIHGVAIGPNVGSCGTAAHERRPVWVQDIQADPRWTDFREVAQRSGLAACCSTPLLAADGTLLGTIAMYYRRPWQPREGDGKIIDLGARLATIAIERDRNEQALRRNAERLRTTFEQAGVGITSTDAAGQYVEMNPKFCEIVGYTADELRTRTFRDLTHPDDLPATEAAVADLAAGRTRDYVVEKRYLRKGGTPVWCRVTATLSHDATGSTRFIRLVEDISERKATEEALRRSEQFGRGVIESSRDCIKTLTLRGDLTWISERGLQALCIDDPGSVLGRSWIDFWEGEHRAAAQAAVDAAAAGGNGSFVGRYEVQGQDRWWDVAVTPIRDGQGQPESLLAVSRDITERFETAARVKESAEQLQQLANLIPQLAWMAEPDGHIFWFNEGWYRYTGTSLEAMQGWGWQSVHDPQMLPRVVERWQASLATGAPFEMEFPLRGADGVFRWFLTRVNPMRDSQGRVIRWFGTNTDVDGVRRVRQALEEETRVLERLNEAGRALASTLDLQALLQAITDAATALSGAQIGAFFYNSRDERGEAFKLYTLSGAPREEFEHFGQPRATGLFGPIFRGEAAIRCDDVLQDPRYGKREPHRGLPPGHPPVRSYLALPVITASGEVLGGLFFGHAEPGVFTERAERLVSGIAAQAAVAIDNARLYQAAQKAAQERKLLLESERAARSAAEHAARMKDEFLATLSHELRTPLSAILGWAQVLRLKAAAPDEVRKGMEAIERNARVQKQLIEDLLDMSRIVSGKLRLELQPLALRPLVEAALDTVRPSAEAKGVRLEPLVDATPAQVRGDAARLQQVVWNLLVNAVKFTPPGGRVQVALRAGGDAAEIVVSDTGQGIEAPFLAHVFDRFRQADASITRRHGGLGLGLAIVRNLVELHGGSVRADSAGRDQGATFTVTLPLAAAAQDGLAAGPADAPARDFRVADLAGVRVVVVDDQGDARELVARVLAECNATVQAAGDAAGALELVRRERPHVLVSDIGMPDVDGFELLARVRALGAEHGGDVPAIALTAFARPEDRRRALQAGFAHHVAKPIEPAELVAMVARTVAGGAAPS